MIRRVGISFLTLLFFVFVMFHIYILQSVKTGRYYCGQTSNLTDRLERHNGGWSKSTKAERPWKLVWTTEVASRSDAVRLESKIKKRGIQRYLEQESGFTSSFETDIKS